MKKIIMVLLLVVVLGVIGYVVSIGYEVYVVEMNVD